MAEEDADVEDVMVEEDAEDVMVEEDVVVEVAVILWEEAVPLTEEEEEEQLPEVAETSPRVLQETLVVRQRSLLELMQRRNLITPFALETLAERVVPLRRISHVDL